MLAFAVWCSHNRRRYVQFIGPTHSLDCFVGSLMCKLVMPDFFFFFFFCLPARVFHLLILRGSISNIRCWLNLFISNLASRNSLPRIWYSLKALGALNTPHGVIELLSQLRVPWPTFCAWQITHVPNALFICCSPPYSHSTWNIYCCGLYWQIFTFCIFVL